MNKNKHTLHCVIPAELRVESEGIVRQLDWQKQDTGYIAPIKRMGMRWVVMAEGKQTTVNRITAHGNAVAIFMDGVRMDYIFTPIIWENNGMKRRANPYYEDVEYWERNGFTPNDFIIHPIWTTKPEILAEREQFKRSYFDYVPEYRPQACRWVPVEAWVKIIRMSKKRTFIHNLTAEDVTRHITQRISA